MLKLLVAFFVSFVALIAANTDVLCKFNNSNFLKDDHIPEGVAFHLNYTVSVRYTDFDTNTTALVKEQKVLSELRVKKITRHDVKNIIIGDHNITFNETSCSAFTDASALPTIYSLHEDVKKALNFHGFSVDELVNGILKRNFTNQHYIGNATTVGGIEAVEWLGCDNSTSGDTAMQVAVTFAGDQESSLQPYSPRVKNPIVLSIHILLFNVTDNNVLSHSSFDIVELDIPDHGDDAIELPAGLFCSGMPDADLPASLPTKLEAVLDYTDIPANTIHSIPLLFDADERITSFRLDLSKDTDVPFIGNVSLPKNLSAVNVVHDFNYGLEYLLDGERSSCINVSAINPDFGDVVLINADEKEIDLKPISEILLNITHAKFYKQGKRISDDGVALDVYVSTSGQSPARSVVEVLFASEPWKLGGVSAPFLHSIIQYHKNDSGAETARTVIRVHSMRNRTGARSRWDAHSIFSCLNFDEESYLYVNIKNSSLQSLEKIGFTLVENALREVIARTANVSVLRVDNFFFKQIQESVTAFFVIAGPSGKTPANTRNRMNESTTAEARDLLNSTIMAHDLSFEVVGTDAKTELKLSQSSLGMIPPKWGPVPPPAPSFTGYSGSSMFVLAVFMLLLGAGIGVGGMFFMWKRQRIAGLAYQVFE